jgi:hypothetical protein
MASARVCVCILKQVQTSCTIFIQTSCTILMSHLYIQLKCLFRKHFCRWENVKHVEKPKLFPHFVRQVGRGTKKSNFWYSKRNNFSYFQNSMCVVKSFPVYLTGVRPGVHLRTFIYLHDIWKGLWVIWDTIFLQECVHASWTCVRKEGRNSGDSLTRFLLVHDTYRHHDANKKGYSLVNAPLVSHTVSHTQGHTHKDKYAHERPKLSVLSPLFLYLSLF